MNATNDLAIQATGERGIVLPGWPRSSGWWIAIAAVAAAVSYLIARYIGLGPAVGPWAYWPINGVLCGILYRRPYREWAALGLSAAVAQILIIYGIRGDLADGATVIGAGADVVQAVLGAWMVRRVSDSSGPLETPRDLAWFVAVAVCLVPLAVTPLAGVAFARGLGLPVLAAWRPLFVGNSLSMLLFAPPLMYPRGRTAAVEPWRAGAVETALGQVATVLLAVIVFASAGQWVRFAVVPYAMFPLLTWAALRGGPRWASVSILAIATVAAWCTARGRGPFAVNDGALPGSPVFELQLYLALLAISALLLSAFSEQRRRALETLTLQTAIREGFLNGSAAMLVLKDLADRNVIVNTAYAAMVGRSRSDLVGRSNVEFLSPDDAALMRARDRRVIERGEPITFDESLDLNGKRRLFVVTRFPVRDVYGTISYIGVIAREVTVERELTSRLQRAQRVEMVGHLAAGLAHDLNNMLTAIELNAGGIRESAELSPDDSSALDAITTATASATKLTRRLMALGRAQAPAPVPIAIDDAIRELTPMFQVLVRGLIDLDIELRAPGARVLADPLAVEQIALNLVSNARDAIATEGSITVATTVVPAAEVAVEESVRTLTAHWVRLRVSDTGHGMDDATLRSLFEPFFTTKGSAGTGLGLYTTSLLVREAGGVIRATSSAGAGTVFTVDLPLLAGSPPP